MLGAGAGTGADADGLAATGELKSDVGADLAGSDDEGAHDVSWLSETRAVLSVVFRVRLARRDVKSTARVVDIALLTP
ncbi:hypothetical protein GCM10008944_15330 [Cytobacillus oceanisediminis]